MFDQEILRFIKNYYVEYIYFFLAAITSLVLFRIQGKSKRLEGIEFPTFRKAYNLVSTVLFSGFYVILLKHNRFFNYYDYGTKLRYIAIFCAASIVAGGIIWAVINGFYIAVRKVWPVICRNKVGVGVFLFGIVMFYLNKPKEIIGWSNIWYAADYSMGMGSRFFIGQLLRFMFGDHINENQVFHFWEANIILLILLVAYLSNCLYKKARETSTNTGILFLVLLYIAQPGSPWAFWADANAGRPETYTLIIVLLSLVIFMKVKSTTVKYFVISLLCCIANAIYQGFVFLYYPALLLALGYDAFIAHKNRYTKILFVINVLLTSLTFIQFQFFSFVNYATPEGLVWALSSHGDFVKQNADAVLIVKYELFSTPKEFYGVNMGFFSGYEYPREKTVMTLLLLSPVLLIIVGIYIKCFEHNRASGKHRVWNQYTWSILLHLCVLPQYALNCDWGRWMIATTFLAFFSVFYLYYVQDEGMLFALGKLTNFIFKHKWIFALVLFYLAALHVFKGRSFLPEADTLLDRLFYHHILAGWN